MCVACWSIVFSLSLFLVSDTPLVNTTNLLILLPWYDCCCCCPIHGILRGQLLFKIWTETAVVGVARILSCPWFHLWLSLCISILASPKRVTEKKKIQEYFKFTVDDITVLLCFEASCCSSVSWETMSQFLFTSEASRCTIGIEWSSQEANELWKKMLYFVNCNCLLWALSFTVVSFQATRGHYAYALYWNPQFLVSSAPHASSVRGLATLPS